MSHQTLPVLKANVMCCIEMSFLSSPVQALAFADKLKLYVRASVKEASASNVVNGLSRDSIGIAKVASLPFPRRISP